MARTGGDNDLTFGQVESILAQFNHIASDKRAAFISRLKFLQKNGIPIRESAARGRASKYTVEHLFQMALALEFQQSGLTPQRATTLVKTNWTGKKDQVLALAFDLSPAHRKRFDLSDDEPAAFNWVLRLEELTEFKYDSIRENGPPIVLQSYFDGSLFEKRAFRRPRRALVIDAVAFCYGLLALVSELIDPKGIVESLLDSEVNLDEAAVRFHERLRGQGDRPTGLVDCHNDAQARKKFKSISREVNSKTETDHDPIYLARVYSAAQTERLCGSLFISIADGTFRSSEQLSERLTGPKDDLVDLGMIREHEDAFEVTPIGKMLAGHLDPREWQHVDQKA